MLGNPLQEVESIKYLGLNSGQTDWLDVVRELDPLTECEERHIQLSIVLHTPVAGVDGRTPHLQGDDKFSTKRFPFLSSATR